MARHRQEQECHKIDRWVRSPDKPPLGRIYQIQLSADPKFTPDKWVKFYKDISGDREARKPVQDSCSRNTKPDVRDQWCAFAYAFQQTLNDARSTIEYHVNMRAPPKNTQPQKNTQ